jgi:hypothetical protein
LVGVYATSLAEEAAIPSDAEAAKVDLRDDELRPILQAALAYRIQTILTDKGVQFVDRTKASRKTWIGHPWTNGRSRG